MWEACPSVWRRQITANVVGYDGSKYINVIGDMGSGYMDAMHLKAKSDLTEAFVEFVKKIRATLCDTLPSHYEHVS